MFALWLGLSIVGAYLSGSVSYAILITRARTGRDIRDLGNRNPGTANVGRMLGRGWGALVLLLDVLKALVPMLAARILFFPGPESAAILAVYAVGLAAVIGHCRPLFFELRGGGGVAPSLAVFFFFTPLEFGASLLLGALVVLLFVRRAAFRIGRWIPMMSVVVAPFLTAAAMSLPAVGLGGLVPIGGRPWSVLAGVAATSILLTAFNVPMIAGTLAHPREPTSPH
jgi:glycerol-3-phosphate acyltransferase PlsY